MSDGERSSLGPTEGVGATDLLTGAPLWRGPVRVLVVDDEPSLRALFATLFAAPEFAASVHENADSALGAFERGRFDVALVDKNLPGRSGLQLLEELRARDDDLPVIIVTGYASLKSALEALRLGAYDYLEKPFSDIDVVVQRVRNASEKRALTVTNRMLVDDLRRTNHKLVERNVELLEMQEELVRQLRLASAGQLAALAGAELADPVAGIKSNIHVLAGDIRPALELLTQLSAASRGDQPAEALLRIIDEALARGVLHDAAAYAADLSSALGEMKEELERLATMIRAMQVFSSQGRVETRPFDIRRAIDRALELAERQRRRDGVELRCDVPADLPPARGVPLLLAQAVFHVLQNALEALGTSPRAAEGFIEVRVRAEAGFLRIIVTDSGPGIPRSALPRVLKPFFTTKEGDRHAGLGLNLAQEIVRRHGGQLRVDSDPGIGTRVTMTVPTA